MLNRTPGANTNSLHPDQAAALFITQAIASALALFGQNQLEAAAASLKVAEDTTYTLTDKRLRERLGKLVMGAAESMLAINVGALVRAQQGGADL